MKAHVLRILALLLLFVSLGLNFSTAAHAQSEPDAAPDHKLVVKPPLFGPTLSMAMPLVPGKPVGMSIGVQAIVPIGCMRLGFEAFVSTPVTAFTPALGGDIGFGCVNKAGTGGAVAVYYRHTLAHDFADATITDVKASDQVGPALIFLNKPLKELPIVVMVPLIVWVDPVSKAVTPTLAVKFVTGVPYKHK